MAAVLAVIFVLVNKSELPSVWNELRHADVRWLLLALAAMLASFTNLGALHASAQRAVGLSSSRRLLVTAVKANSLNLVVKSGGMAGLTAFLTEGRRRQVSRGKIIAAYVLVTTLLEVAFAALLILVIGVVVAGGRITAPEAIACAVFAVYLAIRVAILVVAWRSRETLRAVFTWPSRVWAWLTRHPLPQFSHESADELFEALQIVRAAPKRALPTTGHALLVDVIGVIELWAVCRSIGAGVALGVAFIGYVVSVLFAIVSVLPGGLGFVELSLGAVLVSYGATVVTAAAAVVLYRLFELWLPLLAGGLATVRLGKPVVP